MSSDRCPLCNLIIPLVFPLFNALWQALFIIDLQRVGACYLVHCRRFSMWYKKDIDWFHIGSDLRPRTKRENEWGEDMGGRGWKGGQGERVEQEGHASPIRLKERSGWVWLWCKWCGEGARLGGDIDGFSDIGDMVPCWTEGDGSCRRDKSLAHNSKSR